MGLFSKLLGGGTPSTIQCDEAEYLIWKYPEDTVKNGASIVVNDGEVAILVGISQNCVEGPATYTTTEKLSALYFINLAGSNRVEFAIQYFGVHDVRYADLNVPVSVHGSINFNIEDYRAFMRMHRLISFDMAAFQKKIKDAVVKYVKSVVSRISTENQIPLVGMETKIFEVSEILQQYLQSRMANDFAINVRAVDINAIHFDEEDDNYKELRALTHGQTAEKSQVQHQNEVDMMKAQSSVNIDELRAKSKLDMEAMQEMQRQDLLNRGTNLNMDREYRAQDLEDRRERMRIERELGEKAGSAQIDELQKSGRMAVGGMAGVGNPFGGINPSGINISGINLVESDPEPAKITHQQNMGMSNGLNMGGSTPPPLNSAPPQVPPQIPIANVYVAIGGQQQGPFDYAMLKQMVQDGGLTAQTLVWKEGLSAWTPAEQVPEVASILNAPKSSPEPPTVPPIIPPGVPPTL